LLREFLGLNTIDSLACLTGLLNESKDKQNAFSPALLAGFYNALFSTLMEPPLCGCRQFILSYLQQVFFQKDTLLKQHWKIDKQDIDTFLTDFDVKEDGIPDIDFSFYRHRLISLILKSMTENNHLLIDEVSSTPSQKMLRLTNELKWLYEIILINNKSPPINLRC